MCVCVCIKCTIIFVVIYKGNLFVARGVCRVVRKWRHLLEWSSVEVMEWSRPVAWSGVRWVDVAKAT